MKSAEVFNGKTFVTVHVGDEMQLYGQFLNPYLQMQFTSTVGITVYGTTTNLFSGGTLVRIDDIVAQDELAQMALTAEDVEVETMDYPVNEIKEDVVETTEDTLQVQKNLSKKNLVAIIEEHNLGIDTKQTKAKLYEELEGLDNVEII